MGHGFRSYLRGRTTTMNKYKVLAAACFALLLAAACGSTGGLGDIFGTNPNNTNGTYTISGTVDSIDLNNHYIYLTNVSGYTSNLRDSSTGNTARVSWDNRTTVNFNGRSYRPEDLERGDQVSVRVDQNRNQLLAESMDVTYNSRGGMASSSSNGTYGTYGTPSSNYGTLRGTVRFVDPSTRTITIDSASWMSGFQGTNSSSLTVRYDPNAQVNYNGQLYPVTNLERGDIVDFTVQNLGSGNYLATSLNLVRDVNAR